MTSKKLLDHDAIKEPWEVNSEGTGVIKSRLHRKKDQQPFKKMRYYLIMKDPKLGQARPLYYNHLYGRKFPQPKPIFTFEVKH